MEVRLEAPDKRLTFACPKDRGPKSVIDGPSGAWRHIVVVEQHDPATNEQGPDAINGRKIAAILFKVDMHEGDCIQRRHSIREGSDMDDSVWRHLPDRCHIGVGELPDRRDVDIRRSFGNATESVEQMALSALQHREPSQPPCRATLVDAKFDEDARGRIGREPQHTFFAWGAEQRITRIALFKEGTVRVPVCRRPSARQDKPVILTAVPYPEWRCVYRGLNGRMSTIMLSRSAALLFTTQCCLVLAIQ